MHSHFIPCYAALVRWFITYPTHAYLIEHLSRAQILKLGQDPQPLDQGQFTAAAFFLATISIQIKNGLSFAVWSKTVFVN